MACRALSLKWMYGLSRAAISSSFAVACADAGRVVRTGDNSGLRDGPDEHASSGTPRLLEAVEALKALDST